MVDVNRLTARFFDQGLELLAHEGYAGFKLAPLCKGLGVSTGAFYHSFNSWRDFTSQLLEYWQQERTVRLVEIVEQNPDPLERLETLLGMTLALPHRAEAAIRVWSLTDPEVAAVQEAVDTQRYDVIYPAFLELVGDPAEAAHFSRAGLYLLIGFEQAESIQSVESLAWALEQLRQAAAERMVSSQG